MYDERVMRQKIDYIHTHPMQDKWRYATPPKSTSVLPPAFTNRGLTTVVFDVFPGLLMGMQLLLARLSVTFKMDRSNKG